MTENSQEKPLKNPKLPAKINSLPSTRVTDVTKKRTRDNKKLLLEVLPRVKGQITKAVKIVGISRQTHYRWKREDEEYNEAYELEQANLFQETRQKARAVLDDALDSKDQRIALQAASTVFRAEEKSNQPTVQVNTQVNSGSIWELKRILKSEFDKEQTGVEK